MTRHNSIYGVIALCIALSVASVACTPSTSQLPRPPDVVNKELLDAVKSDKLETVRGLLASGAAPDLVPTSSTEVSTPLMIACEKGYVGMTALLLAAGADPNLREGHGDWGKTPLVLVAQFGRTDIAKLLVKAGANINARHGPFQPRERIANDSSALDYAVANGHTEMTQFLILNGAPPTKRALYSAITSDRVDLVWLLLSAGASPVEPFTFTGRTPLEIARLSANKGRPELLATIQSFIGPVTPGK